MMDAIRSAVEQLKVAQAAEKEAADKAAVDRMKVWNDVAIERTNAATPGVQTQPTIDQRVADAKKNLTTNPVATTVGRSNKPADGVGPYQTGLSNTNTTTVLPSMNPSPMTGTTGFDSELQRLRNAYGADVGVATSRKPTKVAGLIAGAMTRG
jgi:hypothetical protein